MGDFLRIDQWLSLHGLANSRTHGAALVEAGQVELLDQKSGRWAPVTKVSQRVPSSLATSDVRIQCGPANRFVSRGGLKLEGALQQTQLNVTSARVLDVGISTGGFADCCLQAGALEVIGVDVGTGQLASSLLQDQRLKAFEGVNAKKLSEYQSQIPELRGGFDVIVGDLSFISLTVVLPQLPSLLRPEGKILFLVKPQFELESKALNKKGLVRDPKSYDLVKTKILVACAEAQLHVLDYFDSSLPGKDGNREFFVFAVVKAPIP